MNGSYMNLKGCLEIEDAKRWLCISQIMNLFWRSMLPKSLSMKANGSPQVDWWLADDTKLL